MMTRRIFAITAWMALAVIVFVTVSPISLRPHDTLPVNFDRALAFAFMAALFIMAYPRQWAIVALAAIGCAGVFELLQELSPTRHARLDDALVKSAGAAIGVLIGWTCNFILTQRFMKRS